MRRALALLPVLLLVGCGSTATTVTKTVTPFVTAVAYTAPQSAITPEGAKPSPPPTGLTLARGEARINTAGLNLIGGFEGFSSCPYQDVVGIWTIGYGVTSGSGFSVGPFTPCESRTMGLRQLSTLILARYEPSVHAVSRTFGQNAVDALDSFAYNLGSGIFTGALRVDLERHNYQAAGSIMLGYDHAGGRVVEGLVTRRRIEVQLLRRPDVKPKPESSADLLARRRALRRVLLRDGCDSRRDHRQKLGPKCKRWLVEGADVNRALHARGIH